MIKQLRNQRKTPMGFNDNRSLLNQINTCYSFKRHRRYLYYFKEILAIKSNEIGRRDRLSRIH